MKFNIQVDITPDELKELFTPNENQAKLWAEIIKELSKSIQEQTNSNYYALFQNYFDIVQKNQEKFFEQFKK